MKAYQVKADKFSGTNYSEVLARAKFFYDRIKKKTKRRPYIRSSYFNKDKIFTELFWQHLWQKHNWRDKARRLKYLACAVELIENSKQEPESKQNVDRHSEILHRFIGITKNKEVFFVQIKEEKKTGKKYLISVFPPEK